MACRKKTPIVGNRGYEARGFNGLSARNGQRRITRVMFSAVVHQSKTVTSTENKKRDIHEEDPSDKRQEGQARALPGVGRGGQRGRAPRNVHTKTQMKDR